MDKIYFFHNQQNQNTKCCEVFPWNSKTDKLELLQLMLKISDNRKFFLHMIRQSLLRGGAFHQSYVSECHLMK